MNEETRLRLFGFEDAFAHPVTLGATVGIGACLIATLALIFGLNRMGKLSPASYDELRKRTLSWCVIAPLLVVPILLGAFWVMLGTGLLAIACYREYARATGLFRYFAISATVVVGIVVIMGAAIDHWYGLFLALPALGVVVIASVGILADRPEGYIQRVALGAFGFLLFAVCLGHFAYLGNDRDFRPVLLLVLLAVEANDIFAYLCGKSFGRRKLAPQTSPNKTIGGSLGAIVCTTVLVYFLGGAVFGDSLGGRAPLVGLGILVSVAGQLGDLMLSSIKRDLGIKDMAATIPGHGGLLDRFDSLLLVAPAVFHYVGYFRGVGLDQQVMIFTGQG